MCATIELSSDRWYTILAEVEVSKPSAEEMGATKLKSGLEDASGNPQTSSQKQLKNASPRIVIKAQ